MDWSWVIAIGGGYLLGSVPFGLLIGWARGVDIRRSGSGNIGATNCGRVLGRKWGLLCFLLDFIKGVLPVLVAGWWFGLSGGASGTEAAPHPPTAGAAVPAAREAGLWLAVGVMTVVGHVFPLYLKFKGGKGVATTFGMIVGVWPYLTLPAVGTLYTWLLFAASMRYVSVASIAAALAMPFYLLFAADLMGWPTERLWPFMTVCVLLAALIILRHRGNLLRLAQGTESKLGQRRR